ncbi:MAG: hypothetical protein M0Q91_10075 [Methanoregula sp.]|nr:hypothetical protein [Methanoregula sp.]
MTGVWGRSKRSKVVHFYPDGKTSLCGRVTSPTRSGQTWDESDPDTCKWCLKLMQDFKRGLSPIST